MFENDMRPPAKLGMEFLKINQRISCSTDEKKIHVSPMTILSLHSKTTVNYIGKKNTYGEVKCMHL